MHKLRVLAAVSSLVVASAAFGQTVTNYRDVNGAVVGSSEVTYSSSGQPQTTNYRDVNGRVISSSVAYDNGTTNYRDVNGAITGSSVNTPYQSEVDRWFNPRP